MKKVLLGIAIAAALMSGAQAASVCDIKSNMQQARESLLAMLEEADKAKQDEFKQKIADASGKVDAAVKGLQEDAKTSAKAKDQLKQFEETWGALKKTRDEEIVPAISAGEKDKAKELATGVQAERIKTLGGLVKDLGGADCK